MLKLNIENYTGCGNRTPVIEVTQLLNKKTSYVRAKKYLENHQALRRSLKKVGREKQADSIILYAQVGELFYMFVDEPNMPSTSPFSDMCGNGLRALGFRLFRQTKKREFQVVAGATRTVSVHSASAGKAVICATMGRFKQGKRYLKKYINFAPTLPLYEYGLNSNHDGGEPHAVFFLNTLSFSWKFLKDTVISVGRNVTFDREHFPFGINFSVATIKNNKIYMTTHERNLSTEAECLKEFYCRCNTQACGTAGAVAACIAHKKGLLKGETITTVHPGGTIEYSFKDDEVYMKGEVKLV